MNRLIVVFLAGLLLLPTNSYGVDLNRAEVGANGVIDSGNSSTATLTANSVFTGTFREVLDYIHITVLVKSNVASATDGVAIQWSTDGSTVHSTDVFTLPANTGKIFTFGPESRYFRVVYTNGGTNQSSFALQTILKTSTQKASSHRINESITTEDDAELVKAVIAGEQADIPGHFNNAKVTADGRLLVSQEVSTPPATTAVSITAQSSISDVTDTMYTITNGKLLTLQRLIAGAQDGLGGSKVELFYDPNGDLSGMTLIAALYINEGSIAANVSDSFTGNGTRRIVMRRTPFQGASREVFGRWEGFEQ